MRSKRRGGGNALDEDSEYANSRYTPGLKNVLQELARNELSINDYPSVIPMPMAPSGSASSSSRRSIVPQGSVRKKDGRFSGQWSKASGSSMTLGMDSAATFIGGRNLVFMVGGLSYLELRVARDVMAKESKEIIIGSNKFTNPSNFIEDLSTLSR